MGEKVSQITYDDRAGVDFFEIGRKLEILANRAANSMYLREVLNSAIQSLFQTLPRGEKNYRGSLDSALIGHVWAGNADSKGVVEITFCPSLRLKKHYVRVPIGSIDIRKKTYFLGTYSKENDSLYKDTERIMELLGLKKESTSE